MLVNKIGIVSLSSGVLGEKFVSHEVEIGLDRLREYGIDVKFMENSKKGIEFLNENPKARAKDLISAFEDDSIDMILCAIGGDDTYRLLPYLFEDDILKKVVKQKVFLGFSDTTINHFMLNKLGIKTFYGQAFLTDVCELDSDMLSYSKKYFEELVNTGSISEIRPSDVWYEERTDFSEKAIGTSTKSYSNEGFELLRGNPVFEGKILGGCIESIFQIIGDENSNSVELCKRYGIFPDIEDWKGKILLLETSEEKSDPLHYREMIIKLREYGLFDVVSGVIVGKPQDEVYYEEYRNILLEEILDENLPIVYNINVGHAKPRCIVPFEVDAKVDVLNQVIKFYY